MIILLDPPDMALFSGTASDVSPSSNVALTCTSTGGDPPPTVLISKNGVEVESGPSPLTHSFTTEILDDGAEFLCNASNSAGEATDLRILTVSGIETLLSIPKN